MTSTSPPPGVAPGQGFRRAYRNVETPILGGVASGVAEHLGLSSTAVRLAFIVSLTFGGLGLWVYAGLWIFLPAQPGFEHSTPGAESASRTGKRPSRVRNLTDAGPTIVLGVLALGVVAFLAAGFGRGLVFWAVLIAVAGVGLLWRQADEVQRERWRDLSGGVNLFHSVFGDGSAASYARVFGGLGLLLAGSILLSVELPGSAAATASAFVSGLLALIGLGLVVVPFALRLTSDLSAERAERIRSQERADLAAHLHDSVLQTLAMIQKNAADPGTVARLARAQERDLRTWLYEGEGAAPATFGGALREVAARVEDEYDVVVDVVTVGATDSVDNAEWLRPLIAAMGEAVTNAAKHSGASRVDVFAEVDGEGAEVFIRDRGVGFDPETIPAQRLGVRNSITGRMERHGGTAAIKSEPGAGTEVQLSMKRPENQEHA